VLLYHIPCEAASVRVRPSNECWATLNGNLTSDGLHTYTWDARNQLAKIDSGGGAVFTYDGFGRRIGKGASGFSTTNFMYDGPNPVQELSGGLPTANLLTGGTDEYFLRADVSGSSSFLTDALGSTLALTDASGTMQTQYSYEPFGSTTQSGASTTNSFGYTGREIDTVGLYFYRARYYNPATGRFISEDPAGFSGSGPNLYEYADDSPIVFRDPSGLTAESNAIYLVEWALGLGPRNRSYGPNDTETQELQNSPGVNQMRQQFQQGNCQSTSNLAYGTFPLLSRICGWIPVPAVVPGCDRGLFASL
jgi:RHS repeat-associated protein